MRKNKYTPDVKGVTQWLKDNPTKKNSRGRTVSTGKRDAYKAVGYKGPPLKSKEGNLTNNRANLRLSLRGDNGDTARAAASKSYAQQEFIDYGKRNGYGKAHSIDVFNQFVAKNKAQKASILPGQVNDHFNPNSAEFYSAGENYRNRVGLGVKVNGYKTNKLPTPAEMRSRGVPTTRSSLIQMEFNNTPAPDPKALRSLASKIARDPTRPRASGVNKALSAAQVRRTAMSAALSQGFRMSLLGLAPDVLQGINERTDGGIDKAIDTVVSPVQNRIQQSAEFYTNLWADRQAKGYDLHLF